MAIRVEHELHGRRRGRNLGLGLVLGAFVAIVFALTIAKVLALGPEAFGGERMAVPGVDGAAVTVPDLEPDAGTAATAGVASGEAGGG